jgi:hypothetical protein
MCLKNIANLMTDFVQIIEILFLITHQIQCKRELKQYQYKYM